MPGFAGLFFFQEIVSLPRRWRRVIFLSLPYLYEVHLLHRLCCAQLQKNRARRCRNRPVLAPKTPQSSSGVTLKNNREKLRLASHLST
jgi:hypothetical protein